jgi:hypothetical protein
MIRKLKCLSPDFALFAFSGPWCLVGHWIFWWLVLAVCLAGLGCQYLLLSMCDMSDCLLAHWRVSYYLSQFYSVSQTCGVLSYVIVPDAMDGDALLVSYWFY